MGKIRMLGVVLLSSMATSLLLFGFVRRPDGTLMPFGSSGEDDGWVEYGSDGTCVSPSAQVYGGERERQSRLFGWLSFLLSLPALPLTLGRAYARRASSCLRLSRHFQRIHFHSIPSLAARDARLPLLLLPISFDIPQLTTNYTLIRTTR
jgi:hypothetical protein